MRTPGEGVDVEGLGVVPVDAVADAAQACEVAQVGCRGCVAGHARDDTCVQDGGVDEQRTRRERRAPICPACGVTTLPHEVADPDGGFACENPDCELFGDDVG
ncbi:hypothetical protein BH23ACT9_BH23ACT9_20490 [soil metagenome]